MKWIGLLKHSLLACILINMLVSPVHVQAAAPQNKLASSVTAYDLIVAMNSLRVSNGLPALVEDGIIDAVAQSTAETMAASQMSWHIGNASGRIQSAGYGGGSKVWATENFAVGSDSSIDEIMLVWADPDHMIPAVNPAYCNIGAGVATASNGMTYYVLQAAYTAGKSCGEYTSVGGTTTTQSGSTVSSGVSQVVMPVEVATPDADGKIFHVVKAGQSFWSIAIAYKITIKDLKTWNNLSDSATLKIGQKLFIPGSNTAGYATPTQPGSVAVSTPQADGTVVHVVQSYQTLSSIADAYGTSVDTILTLNNLQADWSLQIGQELLIHPSNLTPSPSPHPLSLLTPDSDGKYYHTIASGENLYWIASLYGVSVDEILLWNGLSNDAVLYPQQKLLLLVTPPATNTPTPMPATATPTASNTPSPTLSPTLSPATPTPTPKTGTIFSGGNILLWVSLVLLILGGGGFVYFFYRRSRP
ncbi:MAG: LysM peptidoglycan-binding domain-containing protein [Anaerolineae bacterium]|nr:LysM peptidoglycan-binding domain-containing protein [Anaerolineae bacterium]